MKSYFRNGLIQKTTNIFSLTRFSFMKNHQFTIIKNQIGFSKFTLLLVFALLLTAINGCKKESSNTHNDTNTGIQKPMSVVSRNESPVTIDWLKAFQKNLRTIKEGGIPDATYSVEELALGVEALINVATGTYTESTVLPISRIFKFEVDIVDKNKAFKDIFDAAYNNYRAFYQESGEASTHPIALDLQIENIGEKSASFSVKAILGMRETCFAPKHYVDSKLGPCYGSVGPFGSDEGFFAGGGDEELELQGIYVNPMCNEGCGSIQPCQSGPTTGYEAIEAAINTNYLACNPPVSPEPGKVFAGFTNIECYDVEVTFARENCEATTQFIGTCMKGDLLNCIYCELYSAIGGTIAIPEGKHFVSINLGHDYCGCGGNNECEYILTSSSYARVCYGDAIFKKPKIVYWGDPVLYAIEGVRID
jgi:hypothetical protein